MLEKHVKLVEAIIFDMGQTLVAHRRGLDFSWDDYHKKFLKQMFELVVSDEDLTKAGSASWAEVESELLLRATGPHETMSDEDWLMFSKGLLGNLGIAGNLEELARDYQELWKELRLDDDDCFDLMPGALETLSELKRRNYMIGISSNRDTDPEDQLRYLNLSIHIASKQWASTPGYTKPSPYMLIMNAYEMNVNPLKCAFVGDYKMDIQAAQRAGMVPILINKVSKEDPSELATSL